MTHRTSALRYAKALLQVALAEDDPQAVEQQLAAVVDLFRGHAGLWAAMTNPAVPAPRKLAIAADLLPKLDVSPVVRKLTTLLASRDRIALLPDLLSAYRDRLLDHRKVVRASVTAAVPLSPDQATQIERRLAALTGRSVVMTSATDPGLVGGVVARIGSTVYDGSVKRQLEKMRDRLAGAV